jgi:hypothetical protein
VAAAELHNLDPAPKDKLMRNFLAAVAVFCMVTAAAIGAPELSPLVGIFNSDNVTLYPGLLAYPNGAFHPEGMLFTTSATAATATGTGEQILATYSLPANALDQAGRRVRINAMFSKAANTDSVTGKLYFGAQSVSTGANTTSAAGMILQLEVVKSGSSTQVVWGSGQQGVTNVTPFSAAATETDTAAIVIKATCTDGTSAASDCVLQDLWIEYLN